MYDNQVIVDGIERNIQKINPKLSLTSFGLDGNRVISVGVFIKEKGNKLAIKKLEELGFRKVWRNRTHDNSVYGHQYSGYSFIVKMEMSI